MAHVVRFREERRGTASTVHFDRSELFRLLTLYSQRVANGEWRDYAIAQQPGCVVFAVFRHTLDRPLYTITKRNDRGVGWEVSSGQKRLSKASSLDEALAVFDKALRLVTH
ncbi:MAG TPA: DUF2794 domain-containing protein [Magnetospirillaceae bacterium]|jgi:hypothetical protein